MFYATNCCDIDAVSAMNDCDSDADPAMNDCDNDEFLLFS